jgi:probable HAF family extracellular repeat protein
MPRQRYLTMALSLVVATAAYVHPSTAQTPAGGAAQRTNDRSQPELPSNAGAQYTFQFFTLPFPDVVTYYVNGINDHGAVIGGYTSKNVCSPGEGCELGWLKDGTAYRRIRVGGSGFTDAYAINNAGIIVGRCCSKPERSPGFQYAPSTGDFQLVNVPGAQLTIAQCINDLGAVCGVAEFRANISTGFILDSGVYTQIAMPNTTDNSLYGLNSSGQAVGCARPDISHIEGYLYQNGTFQTISFPGASSTCAYGINNRGHIVGAYATQGLQLTHGFLYRDGSYEAFDQPGCGSTLPSGINDQRVIVGVSCGGTFIATPTAASSDAVTPSP